VKRLMMTIGLALSGMPLAAREPLPTDAATTPPRFEGRMLVSVSDADMLPSAYQDDQLGPAVGPDMLSVIRLDRAGAPYRAIEVEASNSVAGPPSSVAVTPNGRYAVVIETRGARTGSATRLSQLGTGGTITLIDLSDPDRPRLVQRIKGSATPESVAIDPTGTLVAITHRQRGETVGPPLVFHRLVNGRLSAAISPPIPGWTAGDTFIGTAFHPRDPVLALLNVTRPALSFVRFADGPYGGVTLTPWGNAIAVEKDPYVVRFTPDARHVLVNATYASGSYNLDFSGAPRGSVATFRVASGTDASGQPQHRFVGRAETGVVPEGMDVSPDGRFVITTNLERSAPKPGAPDMTRYASMTLIRLDPQTGRMRRVGDFSFDGALPEMAVFDNASRFVAVTVYSQFDDPHAKGSIDFWRIETDPFDPEKIELVKTRHSIPVTRGPHSLVIVR
jgi:hypothetical protein